MSTTREEFLRELDEMRDRVAGIKEEANYGIEQADDDLATIRKLRDQILASDSKGYFTKPTLKTLKGQQLVTSRPDNQPRNIALAMFGTALFIFIATIASDLCRPDPYDFRNRYPFESPRFDY